MSARGRYGAVCAAIVGFVLAYVGAALAPVPLPIYEPVAGTWRWGVEPLPIEMRYYGQLALALLVAGGLAPLGTLLGLRARPGPPLGALWAMTAIILATALFVLTHWP